MENGKNLIHSFNNMEYSEGNFKGLTKREYFAGLAMQGLLTRVPQRPGSEVSLGILESQRIAQESIIMADKLLKELEKQQ